MHIRYCNTFSLFLRTVGILYSGALRIRDATCTLPPSVDRWARACLTHGELVFVDTACSQSNPNLKAGFFLPCLLLLLHNGSHSRKESVAPVRVQGWICCRNSWTFLNFWRRQQSLLDGRTHNAFREHPMQSQWDPSTDEGSAPGVSSGVPICTYRRVWMDLMLLSIWPFVPVRRPAQRERDVTSRPLPP